MNFAIMFDNLFEGLAPALLENYSMGKYYIETDALFYDKHVKNDPEEIEQILVTRSPIIPTAIFTDPSGNEKVSLRFACGNEIKEYTCAREAIATSGNIVKALAKQGVDVTSGNAKDLVAYINDMLVENHYNVHALQNITKRMGWYKGSFVPFDESVKCDCDEGSKQVLDAVMESRGDPNEWCNHVKELCKNIEMRLCVAASFASAIVSRLGQLSFIVHIWGAAGTGKTVALRVAASVWGNPKPGALLRSTNSTENALLRLAGFLHHLPLICDELQIIKHNSGNYDRVIYLLTEGMGRARLTSQSEIKEMAEWSLACLFNGEEPILKQNSGAGAKNRVIQIPLSTERPLITDGGATVRFVNKNYGTAGRAFVEHLKGVSDEELQEMFNRYFSEIKQSVDTTDKQSSSMAVIMAADKIVRDLFWTDLLELTVEDVAPYLCKSGAADMSERAFDSLCNIITQNQGHFTGNGVVAINPWGKFRKGKCYIIKGKAEQELGKAGFSYDAVKKTWADKGYIIRGKDGFTVKADLGKVKANCLCIPVSVMNER